MHLLSCECWCSIIDLPASAYVLTGQTATFSCSTDRPHHAIFWARTCYGSRGIEKIYIDFDPYQPLGPRVRVIKNSSDGFHHLMNSQLDIENITIEDAGKYFCADARGRGEWAAANLIVLSGKIQCDSSISNMSDLIFASCSFEYRGEDNLTGEWVVNNTVNNTYNVVQTPSEVRENISRTSKVVSSMSFECEPYKCHQYGIYFRVINRKANVSDLYTTVVKVAESADDSTSIVLEELFRYDEENVKQIKKDRLYEFKNVKDESSQLEAENCKESLQAKTSLLILSPIFVTLMLHLLHLVVAG